MCNLLRIKFVPVSHCNYHIVYHFSMEKSCNSQNMRACLSFLSFLFFFSLDFVLMVLQKVQNRSIRPYPFCIFVLFLESRSWRRNRKEGAREQFNRDMKTMLISFFFLRQFLFSTIVCSNITRFVISKHSAGFSFSYSGRRSHASIVDEIKVTLL